MLIALPEGASEAQATAALLGEVEELIEAWQAGNAHWIIVSNEVGLGLVPPYPLGRIYRDALGRANQQLAKHSNRVIMMVAGIPTIITSY